MHIVIDVGGTNTRIATTNLHNLENIHKFETPQHFDEALQIITTKCRDLAGGSQIDSVGIGIPGVTDITNSIIIKTPNLPDWNSNNLRHELAVALSAEVLIENDSALYGLAEAHSMNPSLNEVIAYLGIGTGVGGARITNGKIDRSVYGFEPGHQIIDAANATTLESQIGGGDIQDSTGQLVQDIDDQDFWDKKHDLLAMGIYNTILYWSPHRVILGGGMINKGTYKIELLTDRISQLNKIVPQLPPISKSSLGDQAGLLGAMIYLRSGVNNG